jgi:hypothetical protein
MDSGKFSSAAVNRVLKHTGARPSNFRVQVLHPASRQRLSESNKQAAGTNGKVRRRGKSGMAGGPQTIKGIRRTFVLIFLFVSK